ncbi:MAG: ribosome biogenesis factor YjgA [Desulfovibrionaceae bacterium]|nr:ribosome biogenesis factor YjgA [Desulfovibrionaceae bacterium]
MNTNPAEKKSRSQQKRDMSALQDLGADLAGLGARAVERLDIPKELKDALRDLQGMKKHEARRRQMQYIGAVMRRVDAQVVRREMDRLVEDKKRHDRAFHQAESWRNALILGDDQALEQVLDQVLARFPDTDRQEIVDLAAAARREKAKSGPPRSSRALFRLIMGLLAPEASGP